MENIDDEVNDIPSGEEKNLKAIQANLETNQFTPLGILQRPRTATEINEQIKYVVSVDPEGKFFNPNDISDGYHTFGELYQHRILLFIALAKQVADRPNPGFLPVWKSQLHSDGTSYPGWFLLCIGEHEGFQMSYHLPMSQWDKCDFAHTYTEAPAFDGHTPPDVLERLEKLLIS